MFSKSVAAFAARSVILFALCGILGQSLYVFSLSAQTGEAPQSLTVKDKGPRTYRFTVVYNSANTRGEIVYRQRISGEYTRGLPGDEVEWNNVTQAKAAAATAPFSPAQKCDYMEGFHYRDDISSTFKPGFFKGFPPSAVFERNLVWDTGMIERFGQNYLKRLKLNDPYHIASDKAVAMPDVGTFQNRDVVLEWVGRSERNGQKCALINYRAFFNPVAIANGGMTLNGRSDYWGEIWVSLATKQIEYATLQEEVVGEMKPLGQNKVQDINVFRIGTFEPVSAENDHAVRAVK
jgi:hypothetical protein